MWAPSHTTIRFLRDKSNVVSDVQVQWDQAANRWLYALVTNNATPVAYATHNYILWGWSKTGDPTNLNTGWCKYSKDMGTELEDFPKLGHDASSLVIGANALDESTGGTFLTAKVWVVKLPANGVMSCPTIGYVTFGTTRSPLLDGDGQTKTFTPVPTNTSDSGANDYIISAYPLSQAHPNQATLTAFHVVYKNGSANSLYRDGDLNVSPFSLPPDIPQPSTSYVLDSLDGRITQAVARYDPDAGATAIWTTHTIREPGGPAFAEVRWYELLPATSSPMKKVRRGIPTSPETSVVTTRRPGVMRPTNTAAEPPRRSLAVRSSTRSLACRSAASRGRVAIPSRSKSSRPTMAPVSAEKYVAAITTSGLTWAVAIDTPASTRRKSPGANGMGTPNSSITIRPHKTATKV